MYESNYPYQEFNNETDNEDLLLRSEDPAPYLSPLINIYNLHKYYGKKEVLKGINLKVYPGEIVGYLGPNGAGKSTTVKILIGLIDEFAGEVSIMGKPVKDNVIEIKKQIGYVPELSDMYDQLSAQEYLWFIGKLYQVDELELQERIDKWLTYFELADVKNKQMVTYSKGMRQKVLLTSALLHNPPILIFDEPLSGLDANAVIKVKDLMQTLQAEGKTIIYCSHMMDIVEKICDRVVILKEGAVIANGTISELQSYGTESLETIFARLTTQNNAK